MPVLDGNREPTSASSPRPETASKTSSSSSSSSRKIEAASAAKIDRATSTIDPSSSRYVASSPPSIPVAASRRRSSSSLIPAPSAGKAAASAHWSLRRAYGSSLASGVRRGQVKHALQLVRRELRVLREHERGDPRDVRGREAVAGAAERGAAWPCHLDVDATREELDRRGGVRVPDERIALLVAADRDDGREPPGVTVHGKVVRGRDQDRAVEVRVV